MRLNRTDWKLLDGRVCIDDAFTPKLETIAVKAQSEAYFRILERHPLVKDVYTLGNYVIWVTPSANALIIDANRGAETMEVAAIDAQFVRPLCCQLVMTIFLNGRQR